MNRVLVIVVLILIPVVVFTTPDVEELEVDKVQDVSFSIPIFEDEDIELDDSVQVMLSQNSDKSEAFAMDLEDYVIGVVAGEMPASFSMEALKAQAVASRTFAMYKMSVNNNYVLSTTINDQVYLTMDEMRDKWGNDFEYYYNRVKDAVEATEGEILTFNGDIASTYYFAISNGYTDDALTVFREDKDYLVSVESSWDKNYKAYSSTYTLSKSSFCSKLGISCDTLNISDVIRADNHYVRSITINGTVFSGLDVFHKLNLKSTDFTITVNGDSVSIVTLGFGHGVGMSQYGALGMALDGYDYQDILKYYYLDTEIRKL